MQIFKAVFLNDGVSLRINYEKMVVPSSKTHPVYSQFIFDHLVILVYLKENFFL